MPPGAIIALIIFLVIVFTIIRTAKDFIVEFINWTNQTFGMKEHAKERKKDDPREEVLNEIEEYMRKKQQGPIAQAPPPPPFPETEEDVYTVTLADQSDFASASPPPMPESRSRSKIRGREQIAPANFVPPDGVTSSLPSDADGSLASIDERSATSVLTGRNRTNELALGILEIFRNPESVQKAIIINEILNRPDENRWN